MRHTTRRRFLGQAASSAAGAVVCAGEWPGLFAGMGTTLAADAEPSVRFPMAARERIAIASYPFRDFIASREDKSGGGKMEMKEFAAHVSAKFNIKKIEPWSPHFRSLDKGYLEELRAGVAKAGGAIVNMAVDGEHSPYAMDSAERERAVADSKQWIDVAVTIGSPSVRTHIPAANDSKPDVERTAESLKRVAEYGAAKNVVVHLENDDAVSEDPFFIVKVIERVNSPWLRALPDFGNSVAAHDDDYAYKGVDEMFAHAYGISHVKETEEGEQGKIAHVDLAKTFAIAKKHGYKGYFSMEWDSPGDPYAGTAGLIEKTLKNLS
ncbi:MAG TPA: sugar phosphate isomerase/epimerase family protein [Candidatus Acidoferrum sp.]